MSMVPNAVTEIIPTTYSAADILTALHAHWAVGGVSTSFTVDLVSGSGAGDGFSIQADADTGHQMILRRTGASTIALSLQPGAVVTDVGDVSTPPTGTDANYLAERTFTLGTLGAGSKIWLVEMDDAFFVFFKSATGTTWQPSIHMGRVYVPDFPALDIPLGRDGLGFMFGAPTVHTSLPVFIYNSNNTSTYPLLTAGLVRTANGRNYPIGINGNVTSTHAAADVAATYGFVRPTTIPLCVISSAFTQAYANIGRAKYMMRIGEPRAPLSRLDLNNATDQAWIVGGVVNSTTPQTIVFPWLRGVVP